MTIDDLLSQADTTWPELVQMFSRVRPQYKYPGQTDQHALMDHLAGLREYGETWYDMKEWEAVRVAVFETEGDLKAACETLGITIDEAVSRFAAAFGGTEDPNVSTYE